LARFWKVGEVYILAKKDRNDKRFAFARFADVINSQSVLEKIEGTWFGSFRIRANVSRFKRGDVKTGNIAKSALVEPITEHRSHEGMTKMHSFKLALVEGRNNS
jgi:hypothetical protein